MKFMIVLFSGRLLYCLINLHVVFRRRSVITCGLILLIMTVSGIIIMRYVFIMWIFLCLFVIIWFVLFVIIAHIILVIFSSIICFCSNLSYIDFYFILINYHVRLFFSIFIIFCCLKLLFYCYIILCRVRDFLDRFDKFLLCFWIVKLFIIFVLAASLCCRGCFSFGARCLTFILLLMMIIVILLQCFTFVLWDH